MRGKIQCGDWFSLRIRTLILLWIVMIGCGFHVCYIKYNLTQNRIYDNEESINATVNPETKIPDVDSTSKAIRSKRSPLLSDIKYYTSSAVSTVSDGLSSAKNYLSGKLINTTSGLTEGVVKKVAKYVIDQVNNSGILDQTTNQLTVAIVGDIFYRVDEFFEKYIRSFIRFIVRIYGLIGFGSSVLGIYGIHTNNPNCLTFSAFFFQFTIVSEVLLMCEINVDLDMERKVLLLSEVARIDWISLSIDEDPMMLLNSGILIIIAVTYYFLMTVKKCQSSMMKKSIRKEINVDEDLNSDIDLNDYQKYYVDRG